MSKLFGFLAFLFIWICACAFVDFVIPDVANAYQMMVGGIVAMIGQEFLL